MAQICIIVCDFFVRFIKPDGGVPIANATQSASFTVFYAKFACSHVGILNTEIWQAFTLWRDASKHYWAANHCLLLAPIILPFLPHLPHDNKIGNFLLIN